MTFSHLIVEFIQVSRVFVGQQVSFERIQYQLLLHDINQIINSFAENFFRTQLIVSQRSVLLNNKKLDSPYVLNIDCALSSVRDA